MSNISTKKIFFVYSKKLLYFFITKRKYNTVCYYTTFDIQFKPVDLSKYKIKSLYKYLLLRVMYQSSFENNSNMFSKVSDI